MLIRSLIPGITTGPGRFWNRPREGSNGGISPLTSAAVRPPWRGGGWGRKLPFFRRERRDGRSSRAAPPRRPDPIDLTAVWPPAAPRLKAEIRRQPGIGESLLLKENYKFAGMKTKELILREIEVFPEPYLKEVLDFVRFLKERSAGRGIE